MSKVYNIMGMRVESEHKRVNYKLQKLQTEPQRILNESNGKIGASRRDNSFIIKVVHFSVSSKSTIFHARMRNLGYIINESCCPFTVDMD